MKDTMKTLLMTAAISGAFILGGCTAALIMNHRSGRRCAENDVSCAAEETDTSCNDGQEVNCCEN